MLKGDTFVKGGLEVVKFTVGSGACIGGGLFIMSKSDTIWLSDWKRNVITMGYFTEMERAIEEFIREYAIPQKLTQFNIIHNNIAYNIMVEVIPLKEYLDERQVEDAKAALKRKK